jgi:hypothetical protein
MKGEEEKEVAIINLKKAVQNEKAPPEKIALVVMETKKGEEEKEVAIMKLKKAVQPEKATNVI